MFLVRLIVIVMMNGIHGDTRGMMTRKILFLPGTIKSDCFRCSFYSVVYTSCIHLGGFILEWRWAADDRWSMINRSPVTMKFARCWSAEINKRQFLLFGEPGNIPSLKHVWRPRADAGHNATGELCHKSLGCFVGGYYWERGAPVTQSGKTQLIQLCFLESVNGRHIRLDARAYCTIESMYGD